MPKKRKDVELVVAKMKGEDSEWVHEYLPEWTKNIYVVDDPKAEFTVALNKGREAMVILTYVSIWGIPLFNHSSTGRHLV